MSRTYHHGALAEAMVEQALHDAGRSPESCDLEELDALWDAAKKAEQPLSCG